MCLAPAKTQRPINKLNRLLQGTRRRLVEYPSGQGDKFEAPTDGLPAGRWKLKQRKGFQSTKCGPLFPHLLNVYAGQGGYFPLGCAIKPPKDELSYGWEQERWFMYHPGTKMIVYFEPMAHEEDYKDLKSVNIASITDIVITEYEKKKGSERYPYPMIQFTTVSEKDSEYLRLIFRNCADRTAFINRLARIQERINNNLVNMDLVMLEKQKQAKETSGSAEAAPGAQEPEEKVAEVPVPVEVADEDVHQTYFEALKAMWQGGPTKAALEKLHKHDLWEQNNPETTGEGAVKRLEDAIGKNESSNFVNCAQDKPKVGGVAAGYGGTGGNDI